MAFTFNLSSIQDLDIQFKKDFKYNRKRDKTTSAKMEGISNFANSGKMEDALFLGLFNDAKDKKTEIDVNDVIGLIAPIAFSLQKVVTSVDAMEEAISKLDVEQISELTKKVAEEIDPKVEQPIHFN